MQTVNTGLGGKLLETGYTTDERSVEGIGQ